MENINQNPKWSYFRLELKRLQESGSGSVDEGQKELVTEHIPGEYISWLYGNYGHYEDGSPLPEAARLVERYLCGVFVIFPKSSIYNRILGTYDARHNKMNESEFREYIQRMKTDYDRYGLNTVKDYYNRDPFNDPLDEDAEEAELQSYIADTQKWEKAAKEILLQTDFSPQLKTAPADGSGLQYNVIVLWQGDLSNGQLHLKKDGIFKEYDDFFLGGRICEDDFVFLDFSVLEHFLLEVDQYIKASAKLTDEAIGVSPYNFTIGISRVYSPTHLFTKDELKSVLISGNDHKRNTLVIDGQGYIRLIESAERYTLCQFPVINETFNPYNNYTGKHTPLYDLDDLYWALINAWHDHIIYGHQCFVDYYPDISREEIMNEILEHYQ